MYGSIERMRQQDDWYAYLNLAADTTVAEIEQAVERLSRQAAALAVTSPERSQRLRDTVRAVKRDLLSGPEARARYDASLADAAAADAATAADTPASQPPAASPPPPPGQPEPISSRIMRFLRTGWTCAGCGKEALPGDKFCTRCGGAITPTRHDAAAERASCGNCGATLAVNDAFCARCGTRVGK
jgi:ribosomal protein S27AE